MCRSGSLTLLAEQVLRVNACWFGRVLYISRECTTSISRPRAAWNTSTVRKLRAKEIFEKLRNLAFPSYDKICARSIS